MAAACAASVANGYCIQPLLVEIGASLAVPERLLGLLPAMTQVGVAMGALFLLPLADVLSARRLLLAAIPEQMAALLLAAVSDRCGHGRCPANPAFAVACGREPDQNLF